MALQVPQLEPDEVKNNTIPNVQVQNTSTLSNFGGGPAAAGVDTAINKIASDVGDVGAYEDRVQQYQNEAALRLQQKAQDLANKAAVTDGAVKFQGLSTKLLYDPKEGALNTEGQNAIGISPKTTQSYLEQSQQFIDTAPNDQVKIGLLKERNQQLAIVNKQTQEHESKQTLLFTNNQSSAYIAGKKQAAVQDYTNDDTADSAIEDIKKQIQDHGLEVGLSPLTIQNGITQAVSEIQMGRLNRFLDAGQDEAAKRFYEENKEDFSSIPNPSGQTQAGEAQKAVEGGVVQGTAQRIADKLMSSTTDLEAGFDKIKDMNLEPKVRAATEQRYEQLFNVRQKQVKIDRDQTFLSGSATLQQLHDQAKQSGQAPNVTTDAIPRAEWNAMLPAEQKALQAKADMLNSGQSPTTDPRVFAKIMGLPSQQLAKMSEADIVKYEAQMDPSDYKKVVSLWHTSRQVHTSESALQKIQAIKVDHDAVIKSLISTGDLTPQDTLATIHKDSEKADAWYNRKNQIEQAIGAAELANGKPLNYFEKQKLIDQVTINSKSVTMPGAHFWNSDYKTTANFIPIEKIPGDDQEKIRGYITAHGGQPSDDKVQRIKAAALRGNNDLMQSIAKEAVK